MPQPVFAFLAFTSGSYEGAIIRDMRLANELHRRGFKVFIYWMMESNRSLVDPAVVQRTLCRGMRYQFQKPSNLTDQLARVLRLVPADYRRRFVQKRGAYVHRLMTNCCRAICDGDAGLSRRLADLIARDGVTHVLPTFAMICPFVQAAKALGRSSFDYQVTFQGEEIFANFAKRIGRLDDYKQRLRDTVAGSPWPSIAVSADYRRRLADEMGIDEARMTPVFPGIEPPPADVPSPAADDAVIGSQFRRIAADIPLVTYVGPQDAEKGLDLLLYAAKIALERGAKFQLVIVGGTSFGLRYREVCEEIGHHLRLVVLWRRRVSDEVRGALYRRSRCIVYPSIHREPFGLVAAEAMSYGTPVIVPDIGGITEVVSLNGLRGGLTFKTWDSGDLADQLYRLVTDDSLHTQLAADTRALAANFTVAHMTDRVLALMGLPPQPAPA